MGGLKGFWDRSTRSRRSTEQYGASCKGVAGGGSVARRIAIRQRALANRLEASVLLFATEPIYDTDTAEERHEKQVQVDQVLRQLALGREAAWLTGLELFWDYCQNARELGFLAFDEPEYYLSLTVDPQTGKVA